MTYLLAILAACANATSSVLQRKADREIPRGQNLSPRLIRSLLHKPVWFGGDEAAVLVLARSPLLSDESGRDERPHKEPAGSSARGSGGKR